MTRKMKLERDRRIARKFVIDAKHATLDGFERSELGEVLRAEADAPLRGGDRDLPHNSLFGDSHLQQRMF